MCRKVGQKSELFFWGGGGGEYLEYVDRREMAFSELSLIY